MLPLLITRRELASRPGWMNPAGLAGFGVGIAGDLRNPVPVNDIGIPGGPGFGVGVFPDTAFAIANGRTPLPGYNNPFAPNFGTYQYTDGSIIAWRPAFWYRIGHPDSERYAEFGANAIDILPIYAFPTLAAAALAGYTIHRAFWDGGQLQAGYWIDKYMASNNGGIASSLPLGAPLSTHSSHNPLSGLNGSPANARHGVIAAAKTRGAEWFPASLPMAGVQNLLVLAHAQAATGVQYCAWWTASGVSAPRGNNVNNGFTDIDDNSVTFTHDGFGSGSSALTGSGVPLAKTTDNGQLCGICDVNGNMWEVALGITSDGTDIYVMHTDARMADITAGTSAATDAWGANGLASNYHNVGPAFGAVDGQGTVRLGNGSAQVYSGDLSGLGWELTGMGIPLATGVSAAGTDMFGRDQITNTALPNHMCPIVFGNWALGDGAGPGARSVDNPRGHSNASVGLRCASYLLPLEQGAVAP